MSTDKAVAGLYPHLYPPPNSLRLPKDVVRLFGVNWAFAVKGSASPLAGSDAESFAMTALYGGSPSAALNEKFSFHQNLLALDIYPGYPPSSDTRYYPVVGEVPVAADLRVQKIAVAGTADNPNLRQLLAGRIVVPAADTDKRKKLLALIRSQLGLAPPVGEQQLEIILDPDGFAVHAALQPPWADTPIDGWFRLVGSADGSMGRQEPGLRLALDADMPDPRGAMRGEWVGALLSLAALIEKQGPGGPLWLSRDAKDITPENLFWPAQRRTAGGAKSDLYVHRAAADPLHLTGRTMTLGLSPGRTADQQLGTLDIASTRIVVTRSTRGLRLASLTAPTNPLLAYHFARGAAANEEWLDVGAAAAGQEPLVPGTDEDPRARLLDLAVPLIETARAIRSQSAMPSRNLAGEASAAAAARGGATDPFDPVGPLWTFAPIEAGWLHFPLPDATLEGLESLLERGPAGAEAAKAVTPMSGLAESRAPAGAEDSSVAGALLLGNAPDMPAHQPRQRAWRLAVTDAASPAFDLLYTGSPATDWIFAAADVSIGSGHVLFDGAVGIVPFAQSSERLLPDHDERAARLTALRGVSPELLRGIEAEMWAAARTGPERSLARARLSILDFRLVAPANAAGEVKLAGKVQLRSRIGTARWNWPNANPALRPWLWTRHAALPAAQTHALALSGDAVLQPSGSLELFPLVRTHASDTILYSFENALDMAVTTPRLVIDPLPGKEAYLAPWTTGDDGQIETISEAGMASLGQPSVTLHPGLTAPGDAQQLAPSKSVKWTWPAGVGLTAPICLEVRHDLAWRDAFHAAAALEAEADDVAPGAGSFTPLATNGPQDKTRTSWRAGWTIVQRQAALAATDARAMIVQDAVKGRYHLAGFSGAKTLALAKLTFFDRLVVERDANRKPVALVEAGALEVELADGETLRLAGLPASSDLLGVSGSLGGEGFAFGTLVVARAKDGPLVDQGGLGSHRYEPHGALLRRAVSGGALFALPGARTAEPSEPPSTWSAAIEVWFTDVPEGKLAADPAAWLSGAEDHRQGLRWALGTANPAAAGWIQVEAGLWFRPLELTLFAVDADKGVTLVFEGDLALRFGDEFLSELGAPDGAKRASITVKAKAGTGTAADKWTWAFARGAAALLPLERSTGETAPALLKLGADAAKDRLQFQMFGETVEVELGAPGAEPMHRVVELAPPAAGAIADIRLTYASVHLGGDKPAIEVQWSYAFAAPLALTDDLKPTLTMTLTGKLDHRRYQKPREDRDAPTLTLASAGSRVRFALAIEAEWLDSGVAALTFQSADSDAGPVDAGASWLNHFKVAAARGGLLALVHPDGANLTPRDVRFDCEFDLVDGTGAPQALRLVVEARPGRSGAGVRGARLDGLWSLGNARAGANIRHSATLRFDDAAISSVADVTITAHARHRLERAGEALPLATVQAVHIRPDDVDFSCAILASGAAAPKSLFAIIAARSSAGAALPSWHAPIPPLGDTAVRAASARLAGALAQRDASWTDHLLDGGTALHTPAGGEPLASLFDALLPMQGLVVRSLHFPKIWTMDGAWQTPDYSYYLERLLAQLDALLVEVPFEFLQNRRRRGYRLTGPDNLGERLTLLAQQSSVPVAPARQRNAEESERDADGLAAWARRLRASVARWAEVALLGYYNGDGAWRAYIVEPARLNRASPKFGDRSWQARTPAFADPRRVALPPSATDRQAHYLPAAASALHLGYFAGPAFEEASEPALAAAALERHWALESPGAETCYSQNEDYWLSSRARTLYRPPPAGTKRLSAAMEPAAQRAAAQSFVPSTRIITGPLAARAISFADPTYFAPSWLVIRDFSGRAGARQVRRLGLAIRRASDLSSPSDPAFQPLASSELPFHARLPRPPLLARHDWPCASDFELQPFGPSLTPEALLYGPRRHAPLDPVPDNALTREPLSRSATLLRLVHPLGGVIDADWDGTIALELDPHAGSPSMPAWTFGEAPAVRAVVDGMRFALVPEPDDGVPLGGRKPRFVFRDRPRADGAPPRLVDHLKALGRQASIILECAMVGEEEDVALHRLARLDLLAVPGDAPVERPIMLRFQDPAYNDMLIMPAKMVEAEGVMFCADRRHIAMRDRFHLAWRSNGDGAEAPEAFTLEVARTVRRRGGKLVPFIFPLDPVPTIAIPLASGTAAFAVVDCTELKGGDGKPAMRPNDPADPEPENPPIFSGLLEGDRLTARTSNDEGALALSFEVSRKALFPANPAAFSLVRLNGEATQLAAPLQGRSPTPASIELIDPRDLFSGIARFRASYQWRLFEPAPPADTALAEPLYMLQKFAGDGGSYLPAMLADWIEPPP